jgi:membrane associated rhomboid family serine protease
MRRVRLLDGDMVLLGGRFPRAAVLVAGLTLILSVLGAVAQRSGVPLLTLGVLTPALLLVGQLWRAVTWPFFEPTFLPLVFGVLIILFIGRDLVHAWGSWGFLRAYLGTALGAALVTLLLGLVAAPVLVTSYAGPWAVVDALIIAWAALYPSRQILVYFVVPVGGRNLILLTVGGTALLALLDGPAFYVPHFAAEALALAWVYGYTPRTLWLRLKLRGLRFTPTRRPSHLRPVERGEEPPRWLH